MSVGPDSISHARATPAWLIAALAVGVVVAMDPGGWSPFGPAKWLVVSVIAVGLIE